MNKASSDNEKLQHRNRELAIINAIARSLNGEVNPQQALQSTLSQVAELLDLKTGWIWLLDEESGESYLAAAQNLPSALRDDPASMQGSCYCLSTYREGDLNGAANVNFITCSRLKGLLEGTDGLRFHASIPLYAHGKKLGVMNVASADWRELTEEDLQLLYTIGDLLSIAIERNRLFANNMELAVVEERNRLAREIHDTLAQGLTAIILQLETADALLDSDADTARLRETIQRALKQARENLEEARRSVLNLRAAPLDDQTLAEALSKLIAESAGKGNLKYHFQIEGEPTRLAARLEMGLYRVARETLNNILRHAAAKRMSLELHYKANRVELLISDNGQGFNLSNIPGNRFGLRGLNERAKILGGRLTIRTKPGQGTKIKFSIPYLKGLKE